MINTRSSSGHKYSAFWVLCIACLLIMIACAGTIYFANHFIQLNGSESTIQKDRDYSLSPFAMNDAISVCRKQATSKFGSKLQHTVVNEHSTRYDSEQGVYFVVLDGRVGSKSKSSNNQIYCHVDSRHYVVNYFKTHDPNYRGFSLSFKGK